MARSLLAGLQHRGITCCLPEYNTGSGEAWGTWNIDERGIYEWGEGDLGSSSSQGEVDTVAETATKSYPPPCVYENPTCATQI